MKKDIFAKRMGANASYSQYYNPHIRCEWCGILTRGRIYHTKPDIVFCGSCHNELVPLSEGEAKRAQERAHREN